MSRGVMNDLSVEGKTLKNFKAMRKNLLTYIRKCGLIGKSQVITPLARTLSMWVRLPPFPLKNVDKIIKKCYN